MTVRHVVMLRRRSDVAADVSAEQELTSRLDALSDEVPGLDSWLLAANEHDRPLCWDYLLEAELVDGDALAAYLVHPSHQALLPELRAYFELAVVDYDPDQHRGRSGV
jgi:Stress responsive A/B Barrel Domain